MKITGIRILRVWKIRAIVVWPFIFFAERDPNQDLLNHERIHWDQMRRDGVLKFYRCYLWEYFLSRRKGLTHDEAYRSISYEKEAFAHQSDPTFLV